MVWGEKKQANFGKSNGEKMGKNKEHDKYVNKATTMVTTITKYRAHWYAKKILEKQ